MARRDKVIVSCAVTGSIHVPSQNPYLPLTPDQIADSAIGAAEAGAAIVHLHARDPETGRPTPDPEVFARFLPQIKAGCDAVINITTGGGHGMTVDERTRAARTFKPELCSLNMGSMGFGLFPVLDRIATFEHSWEPEYLEMTRDFIFRNTYKDIETIVRTIGAEGTRFEFECYDVGHLYNLAYFLEQGIVEPPLFVEYDLRDSRRYWPRTREPAAHESDRRQAVGGRLLLVDPRRRPPPDGPCHDRARFSEAASAWASRNLFYLAKGMLAELNADQVAKIVRILRELSLEIATPAEARQMLSLKGAAAIPEARRDLASS